MKIDKNRFQYNLGNSKSKNFYKVLLVTKESFPKDFGDQYGVQIEAEIFDGSTGQTLTDESARSIFVGLGEEKNVNVRSIAKSMIQLGEKVRKWDGIGLEIHIPKVLSPSVSVSSAIYQMCIGLELGAYPIKALAKETKEQKNKLGPVSFVLADASQAKEAEKALSKAQKVSRFVNGARYIAHLPGNHFTPAEFAERSEAIAEEGDLKLTVFNESDLKKMKMGGILAVSQGTDKSPKMIILEYTPKKPSTKAKLAIIGKGLTFDAGGISLKPPAEMHEMKYDMCGAAAAIHSIGAIASLGLGIPVIAAIGAAENMPDAKAIKPGDVYTAYNGITVEVQNTDAEGRLVLGDVLSYVSKHYKPDYMVDLATLTGAMIISLGHEAAGFMSNSPELTVAIKEAGEISEDRVWELPFWDEYGEDLKSDIADVRNIAGRPAGSISAGKFLQKFVGEGIQWAHLDVAGTSWRKNTSGTQITGPTGYGVRLLVELAEVLSNKK